MGVYGVAGMGLFFLGIPSLVWLAASVRNRLLARPTISGRAYLGGAVVMAVVPLLLIEGGIVAQAMMVYDGICYGFTDGSWPCSRADFVLKDASFGLFLLGPFALWYWPLEAIVFLLGWRRSAHR
jgi:hypothetical protein